MAINIEWQVKPPSRNNDEEKPQMFPRIMDSEVINEQRLAKMIADHGTLSKGHATAALNDMAEVMAALLREGKTIDIPSLGTFKLSIGTNTRIYPDSDKRMKSVVVRGVNFQPNPQLMDAIGKTSFRWKPTTGVAVAPTYSQLIPLLTEYLKTHDYITRTEFERLSGLKRATACNRLKKLVETGVLQAVGNGKNTRYVRKE